MRPNKARFINRCLSGITIGALLAAASMPVARADNLTNTERAYIGMYHDAICLTLDSHPSYAGVMGIATVIMEDDGFSPDAAARIINTAVEGWCYRHWPMLVAIGNAARANNGQAGYIA